MEDVTEARQNVSAVEEGSIYGMSRSKTNTNFQNFHKFFSNKLVFFLIFMLVYKLLLGFSTEEPSIYFF